MTQNYFVLLLILFTSYNGYSQEEVEDVQTNKQLWLDYNLESPLEEFKSISGFIGYRTIFPRVSHNLLLVSAYNIENKKKLTKKKTYINSYHVGARINYIANNNFEDIFEFRLMQGVKFYLPSIKAIPLMNYIRLEERFQKRFDGSKWAVGFRFRYRLSTVLKWKNHLFDFNKGLYIPLNVEFFLNLKKADRFNDVIRISPGIGYKLNDDWKFELYASYQNTNSLNTAQKYNTSNDFVIRLRIFRLNFKRGTLPKTKEDKLKELIE